MAELGGWVLWDFWIWEWVMVITFTWDCWNGFSIFFHWKFGKAIGYRHLMRDRSWVTCCCGYAEQGWGSLGTFLIFLRLFSWLIIANGPHKPKFVCLFVFSFNLWEWRTNDGGIKTQASWTGGSIWGGQKSQKYPILFS